MKKMFIVAITVSLVACNSGENKTAAFSGKDSTAKTTINTAPYTASYSSSFEMGDSRHAETILALWSEWDNGNLEPSKSHFADTVQLYTGDGSLISGPRDSAIAGAQSYRNMFTTVKSTLGAIFPIKSTDKNEDWVCVWGTEVTTDKNGKIDSVHLQETWRFNKQGKVDLLLQHTRAAKPVAPVRMSATN
jgi:hypothetical protein